MWSASTLSTKNYGLLTSLYYSLGHEEIRVLERAIFYTQLCLYEEAEVIFNHDLKEHGNVAVVVLEKADCYLQQLRWRDAAETLEKGIRAFQANNHKDDPGELRVMSIFLGLCEIMNKGSLETAVCEIHKMEEWLQSVPVSEYTDIQVRCINYYVLAVYFTKLNSSKCDTPHHSIPKPCEPVIRTWQGITDLRRYLLEHGRFGEAARLHHAECATLPLPMREQEHCQVLSELSKGAAATTDSGDLHYIYWLESAIRNRFEDALTENGETDRARVQLQLALDLAEKCRTYLQIEDSRPLLELRWKLFKLDRNQQSVQDRYTTCMQFLADMRRAHSKSATQAFDIGADCALEMFQETGSEVYRNTFLRLRKEVGDYQLDVSGDLSGFLLWREPQFNLGTSATAILEWYDEFLTRFPDFSLPDGLLGIHQMRILLYEMLGDGQRAASAQRDLERIKPDCPICTGPKVCWSEPLKNSTGNPRALTVFEEGFYRIWSFIKDKDDELNRIAIHLHEWSRQDLEDGILEPSEFRTLLQVSDASHTVEALLEESQNIPSADILSRVFGNMTEHTDETMWSRQDLDDGILEPSEFRTLLRVSDASHTIEALLEESQNIASADIVSRVFGNTTESMDETMWSAYFSCLKSWLLRPSWHSPQNGRQYLLLKIQNARAVSLIRHDYEAAIQAFKLCISLLPELNSTVQEYVGENQSDWYEYIAICYFSLFKHVRNTSGTLQQDLIDNAISYRKQAIEIRTRLEQGSPSIDIRYAEKAHLSELYLWKIECGLTGSHEERSSLVEEALENLSDAEYRVQATRLDVPATDDRILRKRMLTESGFMRFMPSFVICHRALQLILAARDFSKEQHAWQFWEWVQKSKTRNLAESMCWDDSTPWGLMNGLEGDSKILLETETSLLAEYARGSLNDRYYLRATLKKHHEKMRKFPDLRRILDFRQGITVEPHELPRLTDSGEPSSPLYVDWVVVIHPFEPGTRMIMVTVRPGEIPKIHELDITGEDMESWLTDIFSNPDPEVTLEQTMNNPRTRGRFFELNGLVQPLAQISRPGELLVLCPSSFMSKIPLHIIEIEDEFTQPLIHRNPLVYCPSLTVLRHCAFSSEKMSHTTMPLNSGIFHGIPAAAGEPDLFYRGRKTIFNLGTRFGSPPVLGKQLTKAHFAKRAATSSLIHIHTHVNSTHAEPLDHYIHFRGGEDLGEWTLTTNDILSLSVPLGAHITLVACASGNFQVKQDEVLGIVPAFLCAGASSVIGTLWNISDEAGAAFTEMFGRELLEGGEGAVNIAREFQRTVVALDKKNESGGLYNWAGFVLHGYWSFSGMRFFEERDK